MKNVLHLKTKLAQHRDVLNRASQVYGVPAETIVAVWGVESNFGDISGKYPLLQALGTLSCEGRRQSYFRTEFLPQCVFYSVVT